MNIWYKLVQAACALAIRGRKIPFDEKVRWQVCEEARLEAGLELTAGEGREFPRGRRCSQC